MKNICFIGAPGCGKSTQIELLRNHLAQTHTVFHAKVTRLIFLDDDVRDLLSRSEIDWIQTRMNQTRAEKRNGELANIEYDQLLFQVIGRLPKETVLLFDGSPRSVSRAQLFLTQPHLVNDALIAHFSFPENEYQHSFSRQVYRGLLRNELPVVKTELDRFQRKFDIYQSDTCKGVELLKNHGVPVVTIDPRQSIETIQQFLQQTAADHLRPEGVTLP